MDGTTGGTKVEKMSLQVGGSDISQTNPVPVENNDKAVVDCGSQATDVDNVSNTYLAEIDMTDASYHDFNAFIKIVQGVSDESANDFTLFWGFCYEQIGTPGTNAPVQLATSERSYVCDLIDASGGATTRYY